MAESYSVEAYLRATGVDQFAKDFNRAAGNVDKLDKNTRGYSGTMEDAIKKSGGFVDAQGRLRNAQGQYMSQTEKAKYGLESFGKQMDKNNSRVKNSVGSFKNLVKAVAGLSIVIGAFNSVRNAVDGAISRYDTLNNFPKVLEMMGFSAEQSQKAINRLSDGIQGLPTTLDDVAGTAQRIATMTGDLDGAVETTLALNNAFISSGSDSANAARGLDQYVQMLSKGEVDLQSWRSLQETMGVALNDTAKAFGFAGKSAQNDLYDALKEGHITFDQFNEKLIELSKETGGFADRALTASGGIRTAFANMNTSVVRGVTNIITAIDKALSNTRLKSIQNIIESIGASSFRTLDTIAKAIGPTVAAFLALYNAIEPLFPLIVGLAAGFATFFAITSIGSILSIGGAFAFVKGIIDTVALSFMYLWSAMAANPITAIISIIAGLAVMIVYLWKTNEKFREVVLSVWSSIQNAFSATVQVLKNVGSALSSFFRSISLGVLDAFNTAMDWTESTAEKLGDRFSVAGEYIGDFVGKMKVGAINNFNKAMDWVGTSVSFASEQIRTLGAFLGTIKVATVNAISTAMEWLGNAAQTVSAYLVNLKESLDIKEVIGTLIGPLTTIATLFLGLASPIGWTVKSLALLATQTSLFTDIIKMFKGEMSIGQVVNNFANSLSSMIENMAENAAEMITKGSEMITGFIEGMSAKLPEIMETGVLAITTAVEGMATTISEVAPLAAEFIGSFVDSIVSVIPSLIETGVLVLTTLIDGLVSTIPIVLGVGIQIVSTLIEAIATYLPMIIEVGVQLLTTLIDSIVSLLPMLLEVGVLVLTSLIDSILTALPMIIEVGIQLLTTLINSIVNLLPMLIELGIMIITTLLESIVQLIPMLIETGIMLIQTLIDSILSMLPVLAEVFITLVQTLIDTVAMMLPLIIETFINLIVLIADTLITNIPLILDAGIQILTALIDGIITVLPALLGAILTIVQSLVGVLIDNLPLLIDAGIQILMALIGGIITIVPTLLSAGVDLLLALVKTFISLLPQLINAGIQILLALIKGIISIVPQLLSAGIQLIIQLVGAILGMIPQLLSAGKDLIFALIDGALSLAGSVLSAGKDLVTSMISGITGMFSSVLSTGKDLATSALDGVKGKIGDFLDAGKNIVGSIADGISGAAGKVTTAISNVTSKIRDFLPFSPAKEGALRDIMKIQIPQSIAESIDKGRNVAVRSMAGLANAINGEMPTGDIAGQINGIHSRSQRQMSYDYTNELSVSKQPAEINVYVGTKRVARELVGDISALQGQRVIDNAIYR